MESAEKITAARIRATLEAFLVALDNGEDALEPWFTPAATMYFPFANTPGLLSGRTAIVERFARMNARLRAARPAPPYIGFGMRDFHAEPLTEGWVLASAIFTFQGQWGRRSLLMRRDGEADDAVWRIHHLHASNLQAPVAG